ncbi:MAG: restriction endonuclease subunit S [Bacteroidaceae bacterium]|nr:restriction endonuclease subunit S [Bacteroidaceae bacterium]
MREGWTYKKLGEVCNTITDGSHNPPKGIECSEYRMISSQNVFDDEIRITNENVRFLTKEDHYKEDKRTKLSKDVVLLTIVGTIGRACVLKGTEGFITLQRSVAALHPSADICPRFLMYVLIGNRNKLESEAHGIAQRGIYLRQLSELEVPVPKLSVQQSIIEELDKINELINLKKAQLSDYDALSQSIFYEMFGDPIENEKGWEVKMLDEVGEIISGSTPSTSDEENWNGDINWVTPAELGEQLYYGETVRKLTKKGAKGLTMMPVGTVLLSSRAPIGKLAITIVPMCCNQGFKNIICNSSINNIFLYYYLLQTIEHIKALGRGATFKEVSKSSLASYKIITPPIDLQQSFATRILSIEQQKMMVNSSVKELETLLASRMQYWFD